MCRAPQSDSRCYYVLKDGDSGDNEIFNVIGKSNQIFFILQPYTRRMHRQSLFKNKTIHLLLIEKIYNFYIGNTYLISEEKSKEKFNIRNAMLMLAIRYHFDTYLLCIHHH